MFFSDNPRIGHSDVIVPSAELTAAGAVAVNGSADVPRMGPPRPRSPDAPPAPPTPARAALAQHQAALIELQADHQRASKPVEFLRAQLASATSDLQRAEAKLAEIDATHSAALAKAAREGTEVVAQPSSMDAEAHVSRARRNCNSVRQALDECLRDQQGASAAHEAAKAKFDQIALAILVEEHEAHLRLWADAHARSVEAELVILGLQEAIGEHGRALNQKDGSVAWLQALERLRQPSNAAAPVEAGPRQLSAAAQRWSAVLRRLETDPSAILNGPEAQRIPPIQGHLRRDDQQDRARRRAR